MNLVDTGTNLYNGAWIITVSGQYMLNVFLGYVGGLRGAYYTDSGMQNLYYARVDSAINFVWNWITVFQVTPVANDISPAATGAYPADDFSVVWTGVLSPPTSEVYRFYVNLSPNVGAQINLNGQVVLNAWGLQPVAAEPFVDVKLMAKTQYNLRIMFRAASGNATIVWYWSTLSIPKQIVPAQFLSYVLPVAQSPYTITIVPNVVTSNTSYIVGTLPQFIGVTPLTFTIQLRDAYKNNQLTSTAAIAALITTTLTGSPAVTGTCAPNAAGNGLYDITLTPTTYGIQTLHIYHNGVLLSGLPVSVNVVPGPTLATFSTVVTRVKTHTTTSTSTNWLQTSLYNSTTGFNTSFIIEARDGNSNPRLVGGSVFTVTLTGSTGTPSTLYSAVGQTITALVVDNQDGTYTVTYTPYVSGIYSLSITLLFGGVQVAACGSPWKVTVNAAIPNALTSYVNNLPSKLIASPVITAGVYTANGGALVSTQKVQMVDQWGNLHRTGGNFLVVKYTDNYGVWQRGSVLDNNDGTYTLSWVFPSPSAVACSTTTCPGKSVNNPYTVHVYLVGGHNNMLNGLRGTYYNNRWLQGPPDMVRVDPFIMFNWGQDLITSVAASYVSVEWTGYIRPIVTTTAPTVTDYGIYNFGIEADDSVRLYIDGTLVIDTWGRTTPGLVTGSFTFPRYLSTTTNPNIGSVAIREGTTTATAVTTTTTTTAAGNLYDIILQYRQNTNSAYIRFYWSTSAVTGTAAQLVPNRALFSAAQNLTNSPFSVTAT